MFIRRIIMNAIRNQELNSSAIARLGSLKLRQGAAFGIIILAALVAFEIFNFSTTDYALGDLLGGLEFAGLRWSTILAVAFCGIDFAGIARLFSPARGEAEPREAWYLFGAWLLAATMNAILTWWGVSMAILSHPMESSIVMEQGLLIKAVPVFVSVMVWLIRILIIGSLSYTGGKLFTTSDRPHHRPVHSSRPVVSQGSVSPAAAHYSRPANQPAARPVLPPQPAVSRPEPTYHNVSMRSAVTRPVSQARQNEPRR
jgi:hypothetical protein